MLLGGIGVFFPGTTGFASAENSSLSADYNPKLPDLSMEAEFIALAAVGRQQTGRASPSAPSTASRPLQGFDLPFPNISLAGITLNTVGPGGQSGPAKLGQLHPWPISAAPAQRRSHQRQSSNRSLPTATPLPDRAEHSPPTGWIVTPHAGTGMTAAEVTQIIDQGIATADVTRSQLRPLGTSASQMMLAVSDLNGNILGLYRMPDAPVFSIDVAISKARDAAYYDNPATVLAPTDRTAAASRPAPPSRPAPSATLPCRNSPKASIRQPPGPWSILGDPGSNVKTGLSTGASCV